MKITCNKIRVVIVFCFLLIAANGFAQQTEVKIDSLRIVNGEIVISFHVDDLFSKSVIKSLTKGISLSIQYQISLWKKRGTWFDKSETIEEVYFRVKYNKFDQRYIWVTPSERRTTTSLDRIHNLCAIQRYIFVADTSKIDRGDEYYITIKGILKPHSIEDFDDVRNWLSGEVEDVDLKELAKPSKSQEKISGKVFSVFKNLTGFGDRIYDGTSREFVITSDGHLQYTRMIILRK